MKKLLLSILILATITAANAQTQADCNRQVQQWESQAYANLKSKYIKKEGLGFGSDNPWMNIICKPHDKRNCAICPKNYAAEEATIKSQASTKYENCQVAANKKIRQEDSEKNTEVNTSASTSSTAKTYSNSGPATITPPQQQPSAGMKQLQQTKAYANSHVGLPQTQSVAQSIQNFGVALSNYQASRQREQESRENRRLAANQDAFDFINCLSGKAFEDYYVEKYYPWVCGYGKIGSERSADLRGIGKIDSVNYLFKQKRYLDGAAYISDLSLREKLAACDECGTYIYKDLKAGSITSEIEGLYVYTSYMRIYDYDYKKRAELKKDLLKGEYSSGQLLGAGISSLFDKKDTTFAAFCFTKLLKTNSPKYFKKSAYLYLGIIKKAQAISTQNDALLNEAIALLDKGYSISEPQFLKIGSSYSNGQYTDNYSGLFVYPEYNRLLQVALLQEIAHGLYYKYKTVNNTAFLRMVFKYYYGFVDAVTNNPDAVYKENTFNEKDFKKITGLYNKAKKLEKQGKKAEAFLLYKEAAEMGDSDSQFAVGDAYEEGEGTEKNMQEAMKWYEKAAVQGESISQFSLASNNYLGVDGVKNLKEAIKWGLRSANQGNRASQYFIAIMYQNGEGVPKDTDEALLWFMRAAGQGHEKAKEALDQLTKQTH